MCQGLDEDNLKKVVAANTYWTSIGDLGKHLCIEVVEEGYEKSKMIM